MLGARKENRLGFFGLSCIGLSRPLMHIATGLHHCPHCNFSSCDIHCTLMMIWCLVVVGWQLLVAYIRYSKGLKKWRKRKISLPWKIRAFTSTRPKSQELLSTQAISSAAIPSLPSMNDYSSWLWNTFWHIVLLANKVNPFIYPHLCSWRIKAKCRLLLLCFSWNSIDYIYLFN